MLSKLDFWGLQPPEDTWRTLQNLHFEIGSELGASGGGANATGEAVAFRLPRGLLTRKQRVKAP